eukprot:188884_1
MDSPFERIDDALGQYYKNCGRDDYYDANGTGKFKKFVNENEFHENNIALELGDRVSVNDCCFVEMDDDFPFAKEESKTNSEELKIFKVLKHCYKFGRPPSQKPNNELSPYIDAILLDTNEFNPDAAKNACLFIKHRQYETDSNKIFVCFNWLIKNAKQYEKIILHYDIMKDIPYFAFGDPKKPYVLDAMNWIYELVNLSGFQIWHMKSTNYKTAFDNNAKWKPFNLISIIFHVISNIKDHTSPCTIKFITKGIETILQIDLKLNNVHEEWTCDEDIVQDWMKLLNKFDDIELLNKGITVLCIDLINNCILEKDEFYDVNKDKLLDMGYLRIIAWYIQDDSNVFSDELKQKSMKSIEYFMDTPPYTIQKIISKLFFLQMMLAALRSKSSGLCLQTCKAFHAVLYSCDIAQKTKFIEQYQLVYHLAQLLKNIHIITNEIVREIVYILGSLMDTKKHKIYKDVRNKILNQCNKLLVDKLSNTDKITQEAIKDFLINYYDFVVPKIAMQPSTSVFNTNTNIPSTSKSQNSNIQLKSPNMNPMKPIMTHLPIDSESTIQSKMFHNFANDEDSEYDSQNDSQNDTKEQMIHKMTPKNVANDNEQPT